MKLLYCHRMSHNPNDIPLPNEGIASNKQHTQASMPYVPPFHHPSFMMNPYSFTNYFMQPPPPPPPSIISPSSSHVYSNRSYALPIQAFQRPPHSSQYKSFEKFNFNEFVQKRTDLLNKYKTLIENEKKQTEERIQNNSLNKKKPKENAINVKKGVFLFFKFLIL